MNQKHYFSRRNFIKSSALASTVIAGTAAVTGCSNDSKKNKWRSLGKDEEK
jgi:outer membrane murein-binding lipoprotein Lpp